MELRSADRSGVEDELRVATGEPAQLGEDVLHGAGVVVGVAELHPGGTAVVGPHEQGVALGVVGVGRGGDAEREAQRDEPPAPERWR